MLDRFVDGLLSVLCNDEFCTKTASLQHERHQVAVVLIILCQQNLFIHNNIPFNVHNYSAQRRDIIAEMSQLLVHGHHEFIYIHGLFQKAFVMAELRRLELRNFRLLAQEDEGNKIEFHRCAKQMQEFYSAQAPRRKFRVA